MILSADIQCLSNTQHKAWHNIDRSVFAEDIWNKLLDKNISVDFKSLKRTSGHLFLWRVSPDSQNTALHPQAVLQQQFLWVRFLSEFAMLDLVLEFAVLHFLLLLFPLFGLAIAGHGASPVQFSLLVTVRSRTELQTCVKNNKQESVS